MKWIGQQVYDFVATFRSGIIIDDINITTIQSSSESFANNDTSLMTSASIEDKILSYGYSTTTGDITGVTITTDTGGGSAASDTGGSADFSILSGNGMAVTNSGTTITVTANNAGTDAVGVVELATTAETTAGSSSTLAVTPNSLAESAIVLSGLTLDGNKSVTPGDGAMIHVDNSDITDSNTSASGTATKYTHVNIEPPRLFATNSSVTTTDAATLYINGAPTAGTNQTITNVYSLWVDAGNARFDGSYSQTAGDMTLYDATNDGNPTISLGSSQAERLEIKANYESGAQGLDNVSFTTYTAGSSDHDGRFIFYVDEVNTFQIKDSLVNIMASGKLTIGNVDILSDSSGTTTLNNIDAIDATTEATIESAIDTLSNLTTVGTIGTGVWNGTKITDIYTNSSGKRYGNTIKILPSDFMINEDAAVPLSFKDGGNSGVHINDTDNEALAFITIPEGMKATHVDVYATHNRTLKVWEVDLNASFDFTSTTKGTGSCNTQLDITDVNATATNYLAIQVALSATTQRIWGGVVTIAAQ